MRQQDFNDNWTCRCTTREDTEHPVMIPHDAMISEARDLTSTGEGNIAWFVGGNYEYKKKFELPDTDTAILEFEAVYHNAEVYINGQKAASRPYGYTNFYVDLKPWAVPGENEIRVTAQNDDQPNSRWYCGTGMFRPVSLWTAGEKHILMNGLKVRTLSIDPAEIEVKVLTSADGPVKITLTDGENTVAEETGEAKGGSCTVKLTVWDAKLWSVDHPYLYQIRAEFAEDAAEDEIGIRVLKFSPETGFTINGERVLLKGACYHHDNGLLGACAFPEAEERKVRILKSVGYNALRSAHNPCSKAILRACDRLGMLMMDEYVDCWYIHKTRNDYASLVEQWWKEDLRDIVDKDYNHPSVIMYSTGNEVAETAQKKGIALTQAMTDYLHSLDDSRAVTCGINIFFNFLSSMGFGVYSDDKAEKQAKAAEAQKAAAEKRGKKVAPKKKKPVGSEFYNTLANMLGDEFMKTGAALHGSDMKTRDAYAAMDVAGYNYGIKRYRGDLKKYPKRLIVGSETFCKDAYAFYEIAKDNPRILGDFVWTGIDYIGEVGLGSSDYKVNQIDGDPNETHMTAAAGEVDLCGKPRVGAAYTRVAFDLEKGPRMAVISVDQDEKLATNGWIFSKALESWSYRGCGGRKAEVEVYARAAEVELFVNGESVGKKPMPKKMCRVIFHITYQDGELKAVSYDKNGQKIGEQVMKTAGAETVLQARSESETANPNQLVYVPIQYTDKEGIWKPTELHRLKVTVENGSLAAFGSASPNVDGSYNTDTTRTYFGEAMAIVRAGASGTVKVTVADESRETTVEIPIQ